MRMPLGGAWVDRPGRIEVRNPFNGSLVDTVPQSTAADVDEALASAERGARAMRLLTGYQRYEVLRKVADLMVERADDLAHTITAEEGKILAESRIEASRSKEIITLSTEEAKRLSDEVIPLDDALDGSAGLGLSIRVPCGIVVCITPFNFPLHLVCHKVGPAFAAGTHALSSPLRIHRYPRSTGRSFSETGAPPEAMQCLTGRGATIGSALCRSRQVRMISFTGSREVGVHIRASAGANQS